MSAEQPAAGERKRSEARSGGGSSLIVGLGLTGLSCARYLLAQGERIEVADSRSHPPQLEALCEACPGVRVHLGGFPVERFTRAGRVVVSPGVALAEPAIQAALAAGVPVLGDIELFARAASAPVVAVTGSNGKSSVTTLVGEMARRDARSVRIGGNLGPPALDLLVEPQPELFVLELSSFQLETTTSLRPAAAAVLNLSPDHLDRYPTMAAYAAAKARIFRNAAVRVLNLDDPVVAAMGRLGRDTIGFTLAAPAGGVFGVREVHARRWLARGETPLAPVDELAAHGPHAVANALAALALGAAVGLSTEAMRAALRDFRGLPHRCELVASRAGVRWYNDSKATNIGATVSAIRGLAPAGGIVLIAGGDGKGADFTPLAHVIVDHARAVIVMGRDAPRIEQAIAGRVPVARAADMAAAVREAGRVARRGDSVLLSPACASLDMYTNYEARGRAFAEAVRNGVGDAGQGGARF